MRRESPVIEETIIVLSPHPPASAPRSNTPKQRRPKNSLRPASTSAPPKTAAPITGILSPARDQPIPLLRLPHETLQEGVFVSKRLAFEQPEPFSVNGGDETDRASTLSAITQRANQQARYIFSSLDFVEQKERRTRERSDSEMQESKEEKQAAFDKEMTEMNNLLEKFKKLEAMTMPPTPQEVIEKMENKDDKRIEKCVTDANYLKSTKAFENKAVGKLPDKGYERVFDKIARLKANPHEYFEFTRKIDEILIKKQEKQYKIDLHEQALPYRVRLEKKRRERAEKMQKIREEEEERIRIRIETKRREDSQRKWAWIATLGCRHYIFSQVLKFSRDYRLRYGVETQAAVLVQRAYRKYAALKKERKKKWAKLVLQSALIRYGEKRREEKRHKAVDHIGYIYSSSEMFTTKLDD